MGLPSKVMTPGAAGAAGWSVDVVFLPLRHMVLIGLAECAELDGDLGTAAVDDDGIPFHTNQLRFESSPFDISPSAGGEQGAS